MGNCILLIASRERGWKEGQRREGDCSPRDLGAKTLNVGTWHWPRESLDWLELPLAQGAHLFIGEKERREKPEGKEESSSPSGWKGPGVSAAQGDGAKGGAELAAPSRTHLLADD